MDRPYVSDYEEFRRVDERDRELRRDMKAERDAEITYPDMPVATVRTPSAARITRNPPCPSLARVRFSQEICAYCGESSRRCECWL